MTEPTAAISDVHTSHCCTRHGCKYGKDDCTVVTGKAPQEYPCEGCEQAADVWYGSGEVAYIVATPVGDGVAPIPASVPQATWSEAKTLRDELRNTGNPTVEVYALTLVTFAADHAQDDPR